MTKIISIHQPNFFPWLGYFYKIYNSNVFVFIDDVKISKGSFANRNKIKTSADQELLLTVPLQNNVFFTYNKTGINNARDWKKKHLKTIVQLYRKAPFFNEIFNEVEKIYYSEYSSLSDFNTNAIMFVLNYLGINTQIEFSSKISSELGISSQRLVNICKYFNCETYLSGKGGLKYMDEENFSDSNIKIEYSDFKYPEYKQLGKTFVPNLSVLDVLFNCSKDLIISFLSKKNVSL
ncbi:MAG: WbqC family protein [Bacteroidales bacterium]|nr:WbqC family protein [Bacteroidales bacterium]